MDMCELDCACQLSKPRQQQNNSGWHSEGQSDSEIRSCLEATVRANRWRAWLFVFSSRLTVLNARNIDSLNSQSNGLDVFGNVISEEYDIIFVDPRGV